LIAFKVCCTNKSFENIGGSNNALQQTLLNSMIAVIATDADIVVAAYRKPK